MQRYRRRPVAAVLRALALCLAGGVAMCGDVAPDFFEPDGLASQAAQLAGGVTQTHSLAPAADVDWFQFELREAGPLALEVFDAEADTRLWLYDGKLNQLAFDDDSGVEALSCIRVDTLPPGRYFARLDTKRRDVAVPAYRILLAGPSGGVVQPYITVVIDDFGSSNPARPGPTRDLLDLPEGFRFTAAIMPKCPFNRRVAEALEDAGRGYVLHQPMEPDGHPIKGLGPGAVLLSTPPDELTAILEENIAEIGSPHGANTHMGSAFTRSATQMALVCDVLKRRKMLYFDSWTTPDSVAYRTAQSGGLPTAANTKFLDGDSPQEALRRILALARQAVAQPNLTHTGIGHVRSGTVWALQQAVPMLEQLGVGTRELRDSVAVTIEADVVPKGMRYEQSGDWRQTEGDVVFATQGRQSETRNGAAWCVPDCAGSRIDSCTFTPDLSWTAVYDVYALAGGDGDNCSRVTVRVNTLRGVKRLVWDQGAMPGMWYHLGRFDLAVGTSGWVAFDDFDAETPGETFYSDAVKFVRAGEAAAGEPLAMADTKE